MKEKKERNDYVRKFYRSGQGGILGKRLGVSRQRIHQIKNKKQDGFLTRLLDKVLYFLNEY